MDINPMMLLPLLMNKSDNNSADAENMMKMMAAMAKGGNPENIMDMLPVDEKTKSMLNMFKTLNGGAVRSETPADTYSGQSGDTYGGQTCDNKPEFDRSFFPDEIMRALNTMMNKEK